MKIWGTLAMALLCAACTGTGGGGGDKITEAECKLVYEKGFQLQGTPEAVYKDTIDVAAQGCAQANAISRKDYECVVAANSLQDYQDCKVVFRFR